MMNLLGVEMINAIILETGHLVTALELLTISQIPPQQMESSLLLLNYRALILVGFKVEIELGFFAVPELSTITCPIAQKSQNFTRDAHMFLSYFVNDCFPRNTSAHEECAVGSEAPTATR